MSEHAKHIDARENNWGNPIANKFMHRIYDQFNRYSLAAIDVFFNFNPKNFFLLDKSLCCSL